MRDPKREVVITGLGVACNLGDDPAEIEAALRAGRAGPFVLYPPAVESQCRCQIIGLYPGALTNADLGVKKAAGRFLGRASRLAIKAAQDAIGRSGASTEGMAVVAGSGTGDVDTHQEIAERLRKTGDAKRVLPTVIPRIMTSTVSANMVNVLRTTGPSFSAAAACAGGAYNVLLAAELLEHGHFDRAVAGGSEAADLHFYAGFDSMRAYNSEDNDRPERASRPYAADRAGFIFSEGAAMVVLETRAAAEARGAEIIAKVRGYGMSSNGDGEMVQPSKEGAREAMRRALAHAEVRPDEIDYVNTHGTSTPAGDVMEVAAVRGLFDDRAVAYSSTKGYTGHTVSGAGAVEAAFTAMMVHRGFIAPCVNAEPLDPALEDYPPVVTPTARTLNLAMSNSFGFGGTNVSLILQRCS